MTTKEKILHQALCLFAEKGYGGVSVRDISRAVGIKESSLYNHFKSKQDIFDTIVETCFSQAKEYFRQQALPFEPGDDVSVFKEQDEEKLKLLILRTFAYFFEDQQNNLFRQLLVVSQYENQRSKEVYRELYREYPIQIQSNIFAMLMDSGILRRADPRAAAMEFYGPVFLLIHTCDSLEDAEPLLRAHMEQFLKNYSL